MFVENYRLETHGSIMAGGDAKLIPYPKITADDWRVWKMFLPVRSANFDRVATRYLKEESLHLSYGIPYALTGEVHKATELFDKIEVWRKRDVSKDPIAVGVLDGERYLIARWGIDKLIPFSTIKKAAPLIQAWNYATGPLGAMAGIMAAGLLAWGMFF